MSVAIFNIFRKIYFENKVINFLSNSMFAVYLISDNVFSRQLIWG